MVLAAERNHRRSSWGSVQFSRFMCDLEKEVSCELPKIADGIKLFRLVRSRTSCQDVQKNLVRLADRAKNLHMKFSR